MSPRLIGDLLEDGGHREPGLLDAELHELGPPPVGGRRLGVGIVGEFVAERQEKRLREQHEALARAAIHLQRKSRRRGLAVPPAERKWIAELLKPLEAQSDRSERREGRLERLAERPRERLDERRFDRRARLAGLASWFA